MENKPLSQKEFLSLFPNTRFRYIHDVMKMIVQGTDVLNLSLNEIKNGYGVFFTVNGFPSTGEAKQANLLSLNGNYVDFDVNPKLSQEEKDEHIQTAFMSGLDAGVLPPTIINRTQKGAHLIWLFPESLKPTPENVTKWRDVQRRLVNCFKADPACKDPSRVLRVPYTMHLKDPKNPFEIKVMSYKPEARYTLDELDTTVPKYSDNEINGEKTPVTDVLRNGVKVGAGMRHMAMAQVAGLALKNATTPEQVEIARLALYGWDRTVVKSPESFEQRKVELDNTIEGILKLEVASKAENVKKIPTIKPRLWSIGDILAHDFGVEEWIIESLISKQGVMALSGTPGDFKTWVTVHIALCLSRNVPVFGKFQTTKGAVLIIDEEDHLRDLKKRLKFLGARDTDTIHYLSQNGIKVDAENDRNMILEIVKEKNIKLVILDSLVRVHGQEENDAKGMAKVFNCLQEVTRAGASILFTHHHRKQQGFGTSNAGQMMRGSSDILAAVDCHMTIEKKRDEDDRLVIKQTKLRQAETLKPFEIKILKEALDDKGKACPSGFEYAGDYDDKKKKAEEVAEAVVLVLAEGMKSRPELHEALGDEFGKTAIDDGIKLAEEADSIERVPKAELDKEVRRKAYYRLPGSVQTTSTHNESEIPASLPYIEVGNQEDNKDGPLV